MNSSDTGSGNSLTSNTARGPALESTTRGVMRLVTRQSALINPAHDLDSSTDTLSVMLRLGPEPMVLLIMDESGARTRLSSMLTALSIEFVQSSVLQDPLEIPAGAPPILLTDDLDLIRSICKDRIQPHIRCLYVDIEGEENVAAAMLEGADDGISINASQDALRARLTAVSRYSHLDASFRALLRENRELSTIDELTKVANRRFFARHFPLEIERAARYRRPMSLIMCDIDHFKKINDTFGHIAGDEVLREFGSRLQQSLRQGGDWVARVGGEEFAVVLPETGLASAVQVAHKLREQIRMRRFQMNVSSAVITASFGVCELPAEVNRGSGIVSRMQTAADTALYRSKASGRDCVTAVTLDEGLPETRKAK